ncbi:hypothetical protein [Rufibacter soli]
MSSSAWAQSPGVAEADMVINGVSHKGQRITLQVEREVVERAWKTYLKNQTGSPVNGESFWSFAKPKAPKGIYSIEEGEIESVSSQPINIVSKVEGDSDNTTLWWSLEMGGKHLSQIETPQEWSRSAGLLQQFAKNVYLENIQSEVEYAEDVVLYSMEEAKRMEVSASKLKAKISKSQEAKDKLEAELAAAAQEEDGTEETPHTGLKRQETALAAKTRELNDLDKRLQKILIRQEVAKQEMEIMSQTMEATKAKLSKMN